VPGWKLYCWQTQNNYFRYSTLYFFVEIRKPFESKNLYGRVKRKAITIFETMGINLRLARPIEDPQKKEMHMICFSRRSKQTAIFVAFA